MTDHTYVRTGVPGIDALLGDGILAGSVTLLVGGPGSGKSVLGMQMLQAAARDGETGLYLSLEQDRDRLLQHMDGFSWGLDEFMADDSLLIKDYDPFRLVDAVEGWMAQDDGMRDPDAPHGTGQPLLIEELEDADPDRVVLDSLTAVESAFTDDSRTKREYIGSLFRFFRDNDIDAFVIVESQSIPDRITESGQAEFLADAVILLHRQHHARGLEIYKLRGSAFTEKIAPLDIEAGHGIVVRHDEQFFPGRDDEAAPF